MTAFRAFVLVLLSIALAVAVTATVLHRNSTVHVVVTWPTTTVASRASATHACRVKNHLARMVNPTAPTLPCLFG